jgi:predicted RND superfamily exporter protein
MHLSHAWRKHRELGKSTRDAEWAAQIDIGAACMLTAIIVGLAFAALALTDIALVRNFAFTGAVAMIAACPIVLTGHALGVHFIGRFWKPNHGAIDLLERLENPIARFGAWVVRRARPLAWISAILFVVFGGLYAMVPPAHSVREHLPANNAANAALGRYDANFGGAFPIQIVLPARGEAGLTPERLREIGDVQQAAASVAGVTTPLSVWSLYEWVGGPDNPTAIGRLETVLAQLPPETRARFIGARTGAALVTVNVQEAQSHILEARFQAVEAAVRAVGVEDAAVTGVTVVTNREASRMISDLNWSLATAIFGDILLLIIAFRNIPIGIVSTLANTMPLFATGALLWLTGHGMQFTSVIALTVAFGIAVDDTIHYINRFLVLQKPTDPLDRRLVATSREIGPVLIGTTVIILGGMSTTFTSGLPTVTLFGIIASITLVIAMAGDLIVMPALIAGYGRRWFEKRRSVDDEPETSERV